MIVLSPRCRTSTEGLVRVVSICREGYLCWERSGVPGRGISSCCVAWSVGRLECPFFVFFSNLSLSFPSFMLKISLCLQHVDKGVLTPKLDSSR